MYVKITDKGECFSTTMEYIDGVYANKNEWAKHNFYPQNGMVGELVKRTPSAYIIKIMDGIYVPMTRKGIQEISYNEFQEGKKNNVCSGMSNKQSVLNSKVDAVIGDSWNKLPDMRFAFKQDILSNITKLSWDFKKRLFLEDIIKSCVIYGADMCLEYKDKSGGSISPDRITDIATQVTDVYKELFNESFCSDVISSCIQQIKALVQKANARETIDSYYEWVRISYSWNS